jgi:hypothetical protein
VTPGQWGAGHVGINGSLDDQLHLLDVLVVTRGYKGTLGSGSGTLGSDLVFGFFRSRGTLGSDLVFGFFRSRENQKPSQTLWLQKGKEAIRRYEASQTPAAY